MKKLILVCLLSPYTHTFKIQIMLATESFIIDQVDNKRLITNTNLRLENQSYTVGIKTM